MAETQPHRKRIQHFHEPGDLHELTFSCYRRLPLLTNDEWRRLLARSIDAAGQETGFKLAAVVLMPEHVHLLVVPTSPDPRIDLYLAKIKQPFSKSIKELLEQQASPLLARLTVRERPGKTCFRFWQEGPDTIAISIVRRLLPRRSITFISTRFDGASSKKRSIGSGRVQAGICSTRLDNNDQGCL